MVCTGLQLEGREERGAAEVGRKEGPAVGFSERLGEQVVGFNEMGRTEGQSEDGTDGSEVGENDGVMEGGKEGFSEVGNNV